MRQNILELQNKQKIARESFLKAQLDYKQDILKVIEKITFYSAGIISLSVTYFGYLLNKDAFIKSSSHLGWGIYFLYTSWLLQTVVILAGNFFRLFDANYVFYGFLKNTRNSEQSVLQAKLDLLKVTPKDSIRFEGTDSESEIESSKDGIIKYKKALPKIETKEKRNFRFARVLMYIVFIFFVIGIISMLCFVIFSSQILLTK